MPKKKPGPGRVSEPVALYDAKTRLSELVDLAAQGHEFVIGKSGKPMARLVPYIDPAKKALRVPGKNVLGISHISPDFDAPMTYEELSCSVRPNRQSVLPQLAPEGEPLHCPGTARDQQM